MDRRSTKRFPAVVESMKTRITAARTVPECCRQVGNVFLGALLKTLVTHDLRDPNQELVYRWTHQRT